jgi:hypothetical protein
MYAASVGTFVYMITPTEGGNYGGFGLVPGHSCNSLFTDPEKEADGHSQGYYFKLFVEEFFSRKVLMDTRQKRSVGYCRLML